MRIVDVPSELHVELVRPMARFGLMIQIYRRAADGRIWHGRPNDKGELDFTEIEPNSYPEAPTLYIDDEISYLLAKALANEPVRLRGEAAVDHLKDAVAVRDRLLSLVEHTLKVYINPITLVPETQERRPDPT